MPNKAKVSAMSSPPMTSVSSSSSTSKQKPLKVKQQKRVGGTSSTLASERWRLFLSERQSVELNRKFEINSRPTKIECFGIARELSLTTGTIKQWFADQRAKAHRPTKSAPVESPVKPWAAKVSASKPDWASYSSCSSDDNEYYKHNVWCRQCYSGPLQQDTAFGDATAIKKGGPFFCSQDCLKQWDVLKGRHFSPPIPHEPPSNEPGFTLEFLPEKTLERNLSTYVYSLLANPDQPGPSFKK